MNSISFLFSLTTCINYTLISTINQKENTNISSLQTMLLVPKHHSCLTWRRRTFINKELASPSITTPHTDLIPVIGWYTLSQSSYTPRGDTNEDLYITGSTSSITDNLYMSQVRSVASVYQTYSLPVTDNMFPTYPHLPNMFPLPCFFQHVLYRVTLVHYSKAQQEESFSFEEWIKNLSSEVNFRKTVN